MSVGAPKCFTRRPRRTTTRWTCRYASTAPVVVFVAARPARPRRDARAREPRDRSPRARLGARDHPSRAPRVPDASRRSVDAEWRPARSSRPPPTRHPRDASARETSLPSRRLALASALGVVTGASPRAAVSPARPSRPRRRPPRSGFRRGADVLSSRPPSRRPFLSRRRGDPTPLLRGRGAEPAPEPPGGRRGGHRGGPRERSADRPAHLLRESLERGQLNATFVDRLRPRVASGDIAYLQRIVLTVDANVWDDELYFWKNAMGMRVTRRDRRRRVPRLRAGDDSAPTTAEKPPSNSAADPRARANSATDSHTSVSACPTACASVASTRAEANSCTVSDTLTFDRRADTRCAAAVAARRDPVEYVAVNVDSVREAEKYYAETFGMVGRAPLDLNGYAPGAARVAARDVRRTESNRGHPAPTARRRRGRRLGGTQGGRGVFGSGVRAEGRRRDGSGRGRVRRGGGRVRRVGEDGGEGRDRAAGEINAPPAAERNA